jgi:hypothetical protein
MVRRSSAGSSSCICRFASQGARCADPNASGPPLLNDGVSRGACTRPREALQCLPQADFPQASPRLQQRRRLRAWRAPCRLGRTWRSLASTVAVIRLLPFASRAVAICLARATVRVTADRSLQRPEKGAVC